MIRELGSLRWRLFDRTVNAAKIVVRHKLGERVSVILNGLAVTQGQPRKPFVEKASGQIQPFGMRGVDFAAIWTTKTSAAADA